MALKLYLLFGIVLALVFKTLSDLGLFSVIPELKNHDCKYIDIDIQGPEDITPYKDNILIVASANFGKLFSKGTPILEQNSIYAIVNSHLPDYKVIKLEVLGFPTDIAFYPHGLYIKLGKTYDTLYAINHAYQFGGERVEVFQIGKDIKHLIYQHSFIMDPKYNGGLNDLIVVSDNRFIITNWMPMPDAINGRQGNSVLHKVKLLLFQLSRRKYTHTLDCHFDLTSSVVYPQCTIIEESQAVMANGITWDHKDTVWVADTVLKEVQEFKILPQGVKHIRNIAIGYGLDNLEYDHDRNSLILALIPKIYNFLQLEQFTKSAELTRDTQIEYWSAVGEYHLQTNQLSILELGKSLNRGLSGAVLSGDNLFLGSWCDITVMVCRNSK